MSQIQNVDVNLSEIVKDIDAGNFLIPKFQRSFVWKLGDIESLGDSIVRGYPISAMLVMPSEGTLSVGATALKTSGVSANGSSQLYLLDGQQRVTSIAKIFLGNDDSYEYFFDMLSILCEKYPEDKIEEKSYIAERVALRSGAKSFKEIGSDFCKKFKKTTGSEVATRQDNRFISGRFVIEDRYSTTINKFMSIFDSESEETKDKYTNFLNGLLGAVKSYSIPVTRINAKADLGLVIRVFEKVNSSGKKLSLFDLVNAKSFQTENSCYQVGLSDYISQSIRSEASRNYISLEAADRYFASTNNGKEKNYEKLARFARSYYSACFLEKNQKPLITQADILSKEADFWFKGWDRHYKVYLRFIDWLDKEGLTSYLKVNPAFIEYIAGIIISRPRIIENKSYLNMVKKYAIYLNLTGSGFSKSNLDVVMKFVSIADKMINSHGFDKYANDIPLDYHTYSANPSSILEWNSPSNSQFKSLLYIMYAEKASGYFSIDLFGDTIRPDQISEYDCHHLVPKSRTKDLNDKIYLSIANCCLVGKEGNRFVIKDALPSSYLPSIRDKVFDGCEQRFMQVITSNMIEDFIFIDGDEKGKEILEKRLLKITDVVNNFFQKKSISGQDEKNNAGLNFNLI